MAVPVLGEKEVLAKLRENAASFVPDEDFFAFYSSEYGGVVTDPHLFLVPIDDHLVHRGHSVFDTAMVIDGRIYQLEQHLDRFLSSAKLVQIDFKDFSREALRDAILATITAAKRKDQGLRFWMGAGPGGFGISPKECRGASFYCVSTKLKMNPPEHYEKGIKVITSTVPMKPGIFANAKTTNYLPNVLTAMEAQAQDGWAGVWVDEENNIAELPTANIAFVLKAGSNKLTVPPFDKTLAGVSVKRIMEIAEKHLGMEVEQRPISLTEAKATSEAFVIGGPYLTLPIVVWDDDVISDGNVGPVAKIFKDAQLRDFKDAWGDDGHLQDMP